MKITALLAILMGTAAISTPAAAHLELPFDPSGAAMCFDSDGQKALLALCQTAPRATFVTVLDPSGAPMCFTETEAKAPLASCAPRTLAEAAQVVSVR